MSDRDNLIAELRRASANWRSTEQRAIALATADMIEDAYRRIAELEAENERLLEANPSAAYALEYASLRIGLNSARAALAEAQEELRVCQQDAIRLQSALAEARESVAQWMLAHSFATGHGDTLDELLGELSWQVNELWAARDAARAEAEALRKEAARMRGALEMLYPGLVLDLRYADADDDRDALQSRIDTVEEALSPSTIDAAIAKEQKP